MKYLCIRGHVVKVLCDLEDIVKHYKLLSRIARSLEATLYAVQQRLFALMAGKVLAWSK